MLHRRIHLCLLSLTACISAQEIVAPTPEQAGPAKGRMWDDYNIVDSFETGYRFATVSGNQETYRSNVNFGNGIRLMSGFLSVNSKDGQGRFFDTIVLNVRGLATDPYMFASLRVQKNRLYDYRLSWRRNQYVNPGLVTDNAQGLHLEDTTYTLQDHDLTLFPQSAVRFILGYTHDNQQGAGISSIQLPDATGNIYPLFTNVKWSRNEYRVGNEIHLRGFTLNWTRGWQDFKDDTPYSATSAQAAGSPAVPTTLGNFLRGEPTHGTSPYWRVALFRDAKLYQLNGRFTYTGGNSAFVMNEMSAVLSPSDPAYNRQVFTLGNAKRPVATGNLSLAVSPFRKLTISEHLSLYNVRSEGNSAYLQYDNATQDSNILYFQSLGIRTMAAETDLAYQLTSRIDLTGTYEYSLRRITSVEQSAFGTSVSRLPYAQDDLLNTGSLGFRMRLVKGLTVSGGGEVGRSNRPFTPKGDRDYTDLFGRARYRWKTLQLSADAHSSYNANSITLSSYSSHGRTYSGSGSWSPAPWFSIDATYSKIHLDTVGGIAFFAGGQAFSNVDSYYISNLHTATLGIQTNAFKRLDIYLGYSRVQDTGDGRSSPTDTTLGPAIPAFQAAQTFPLVYQAPLVRLSFRISEKLRWNAGYQYFGYRADFATSEDYLAHTGYTSLTWSF